MNILQTIFNDYYEEIQYTLHPRPSVMENIEKMVNCGDPSYGGAMFGCPHCGELKFSPFRCKSRFCPSCGNKYNQHRSFRMSCELISCTHRHCVFTIPEELRIYFLRDHTLLNCLFHAVRDVVLHMFYRMNKTENFTLGFICVLHTFGRDLKSKGNGIQIIPYTPFRFNRQTVQPSQETKNTINNVMAKHTPSLFCHVIFYFNLIIHYF